MDLNRLKRFDKSKHDQLEQLIAWSTMMGLSGTDLVSLGGHIARAQAKEAAKRNVDLVDGLGCEPIGKDDSMESRWKIKRGDVTYHFTKNGWRDVRVTNTSTKASVYHQAGHYELGNLLGNLRRGTTRYCAMLDYSEGKIKLP